MAEVQPIRALRYDLERVGGLQPVVSPPYDVIDEQQRSDLAARSPHNVVGIDLPRGEDPYACAGELFKRWLAEGALVRDEQPALWVLDQTYEAPDGRDQTRRGVLCRVRVEEYGPGRIRPHERTHPGPKEDRLRLTRATRANLSPIFSLYGDTTGDARAAVAAGIAGVDAWDELRTDDGTENKVWRVSDKAVLDAYCAALGPAELLIADGHHRYETARVYSEEVGGEGEHGYVLMCLVPFEDPGLTVFPTHRLLHGLADDPRLQGALRDAVKAVFDVEEIDREEIAPPTGPPMRLGYMDSHHKQAYRLTLRDRASVDAALAGSSEAYRRLDTAVLETLVLEGALGMTPERISHLDGLSYSRSTAEALAMLDSKEADAAFFMAPTPVKEIQAVAAAGENMPPKSTFFHPKVPTGLLFNALY